MPIESRQVIRVTAKKSLDRISSGIIARDMFFLATDQVRETVAEIILDRPRALARTMIVALRQSVLGRREAADGLNSAT